MTTTANGWTLVTIPSSFYSTEQVWTISSPAAAEVDPFTQQTQIFSWVGADGWKVTVTLPDNRDVAGKVSTVGTVASPGTGNNPATIDVTVTIADQSALGTLDNAEQRLRRTVRPGVGQPAVLGEATYRPAMGALNRFLLVAAGVHQGGQLVEGDL